MPCCGLPTPGEPLVRFTALDAYACAAFGLAPDADGRIVWMGVKWIGVPFPLRIWFVLRAVWKLRGMRAIDSGGALDAFAGCGCIEGLKRLSERMFPQ